MCVFINKGNLEIVQLESYQHIQPNSSLPGSPINSDLPFASLPPVDPVFFPGILIY